MQFQQGEEGGRDDADDHGQVARQAPEAPGYWRRP